MKVVWTKRAYQTWLDAANYIRQEYGVKAVLKLKKRTVDWENSIGSMPGIGKIEPLLEGLGKEYHSVVISKQNKLIYSIEEDCVKVDDIWDTRREPKALINGLK